MGFRRFLPLLASSPHVSTVIYPAAFFATQFLQRSHAGDGRRVGFAPAELAAVEALKLAYSLFLWYHSRPTTSPRLRGPQDGRDEERLLQDIGSSESEDTLPVSGSEGFGEADTVPPVAASVATAVMWATHIYLLSAALRSFDPWTVHLAVASSTMFVLYASWAIFNRPITNSICQVVVLQLCGLFLAKNALLPVLSFSSSPFYLLSTPLTSALSALSIDFIYHSHSPSSRNSSNAIIFSSGLCIHVFVFILERLFTVPVPSHSQISRVSLHTLSSLCAQALADLAALSVIYHRDALFERVLAASSAAFLFLAVALLSRFLSLGLVAGIALAGWASASFVLSELNQIKKGDSSVSDLHCSTRRRRRLTAAVVFSMLAIAAALGIAVSPLPPTAESVAAADTFTIPNQPSCPRKPLVYPALYDPQTRQYRHFDNVLLIVFFSHPRYNVNLDYYREVYADFFPNMVFVGPASREDAGFGHSYDVLVDSFGAAEDLNDPDFYQMAGRMAHHMLYTAMKEHPCYDGYLWAPFDTLLNVPRLQQFDQSLFWYHSPFGRYVPNTALANASSHAPPARISPDPALNLTDGWKGWGADWCDPHVGLSVCMPAFEKVPKAHHERLASFFSNSTERFIGGSADTLYIPGAHQAAFLATLALFLETNCFMEIALPTTVHLVVPPSEDILFVDHWWIWQPPFNATFVREKWAAGFEVDTFHTFHWGDAAEGEPWRGHPENIADVRQLLQESAARQGVSLPHIES